MQVGAKYVSDIINALMASSSWKSSVFILSSDEAGGFYDSRAAATHGQSQRHPSAGSPGGRCQHHRKPKQPICDFQYTGFRVPSIVILPSTKKNYVSHTVADYTAILKFVETRFGLPGPTARDAAQMDMTEFFDFAGAPWMNPRSPPIRSKETASLRV